MCYQTQTLPDLKNYEQCFGLKICLKDTYTLILISWCNTVALSFRHILENEYIGIQIIFRRRLNISLSFTPNISFANSAFQYPATLIDGTRLLIGTVLVTFITNCISNAENLWAMRGGDGDGGDTHLLLSSCHLIYKTLYRQYLLHIWFVLQYY